MSLYQRLIGTICYYFIKLILVNKYFITIYLMKPKLNYFKFNNVTQVTILPLVYGRRKRFLGIRVIYI